DGGTRGRVGDHRGGNRRAGRCRRPVHERGGPGRRGPVAVRRPAGRPRAGRGGPAGGAGQVRAGPVSRRLGPGAGGGGMRIALISEHASPLAMLGGVDAGGQNAHVAELSTALAARGHQVRVYTRRDGLGLPVVARVAGGFEVVHVPAGPPGPLPKDHLLPHMREFGRALERDWDRWPPDVAHAHFWMSGLAAVRAGARCDVPVVQTFHALGTVKRRHQGDADTSPPGRIGYERLIGRTVHRVVAQCRDEVGELVRMDVPAARISLVPSGVDPSRFTPDGPAVAGTPGRYRILSVGRLVERKGFADLIRALPSVPGAELVVVGGPSAPRLSA